MNEDEIILITSNRTEILFSPICLKFRINLAHNSAWRFVSADTRTNLKKKHPAPSKKKKNSDVYSFCIVSKKPKIRSEKKKR